MLVINTFLPFKPTYPIISQRSDLPPAAMTGFDPEAPVCATEHICAVQPTPRWSCSDVRPPLHGHALGGAAGPRPCSELDERALTRTAARQLGEDILCDSLAKTGVRV